MTKCTCDNDEYETIRTCSIHGDLSHVEEHTIHESEWDPFKHGHDLLRTKQLWDEMNPETFEEDFPDLGEAND